MTDHEGNVYATVQIGNQCWMRDNLRTTTSPSTGTYLIPAAGTGYTEMGKQARWFNNDSATYAPMNYGLLYNWNAAVDTFNTAYGETSVNTNSNNAVSVTFNGHRRGICPAGWHLPSDAEWTTLTDYVSSQSEFQCGGNSNYIAKALASTEGWNTSTNNCVVGNDPSTNNATGFSAVPAGLCSGSSFYSAGYGAYFWSSAQSRSDYAYYRDLGYTNAYVGRDDYHKGYGRSVRCLRDETSGGGGTAATLPTVTTGSVSDVTAMSATCGGEVTVDGGASVTARGVCWSTSQNPTVSNSHTTDGSGTGSFSSSISGLTANTTYYVRAYATNSVGTAYGETVAFTTLSAGGTATIDAKSCPGTPTVTDYDGNVYNTVKIGNQCWMKENLRTTSYSDGTPIEQGTDTSRTTAYWYYPSGNSGNMSTLGLLYNWAAVMRGSASSSENPSGVQGVCPTGWHVPSDSEWTELTDYVSSQSEYACSGTSIYIAKALASTTGWNSFSSNCTVGNTPSDNNATGLGIVPAGYYSGNYNAATTAYCSSATEYNENYVYNRNIGFFSSTVNRGNLAKYTALSVRCIRD